LSTFLSDGCRLHYRSGGSGPLLILLHNGFYSSESWKPVQTLLGAHFNWVAWDRWGYGKSARGVGLRAEIDHGVEEFDQLLDHLDTLGLDTRRLYVCGHCMGGAIAARWTARNPGRVAGMVLEATGFFSDSLLRRKADVVMRPWKRLPDSLRKTLIRMHGWLKAPEVWDFIMSWEGDYIMHEGYDLRPDLDTIDCPVMVATGDKDVYFKPEHTREGHARLAARQLPSELWIPEGIGHDLHHEIPEEFVQRLTSFFLPDFVP
jgi:pimeloyl-ACP methyl ester carboxylesterase